MKKKLELFLTYSSERKAILNFVENKIRDIPNPHALIEINFGLFSLRKDININFFLSKYKHIIAGDNIWLESSITNDIFFRNKYYKRRCSSVSLNPWYKSDFLEIDELKKLISHEIVIKNSQILDVIANIVKYTYNLEDGRVPPLISRGEPRQVLEDIYVGDVIVMPLATHRNKSIDKKIEALIEKGASVIILEPIGVYREDIDLENQIIFPSSKIPFRVIYHSMF